MTAVLADPNALVAPPPAARRPVVIRPVPRREPPFDDEREQHATVTRLDRHLPLEIAPRQVAWVPRPAREGRLPEPATWTRRLVVGMAEAAAGRRPTQQLAGFLTPSVFRGLLGEFERAATVGAPHWLAGAGVRTVRVSEPADGVAEVCAVLDTGRRVRALAMRVECWRGHWRCTRLQLA